MAEEKKVLVDDYLKRVKELVENTKFGSVTLIVQDGKVIQIDRTEKIRV